MLANAIPKKTVVVADGVVYTVELVLAAIDDPSSVGDLNVFAMFVYPSAIAKAVASEIISS
jgi:hypothetical protein